MTIDAALTPVRPDRDCPLCPRLAGVPGGPAAGASRLVQRPGPVLRRSTAPALLIVGLAPGLQRRQPHRPPVHRRLRRRSALSHAAEVRLRRRQLRRPSGRRAGAAPRPHHQRGALRAAAEQAGDRRKSPPAGLSLPPNWRRCRASRAILALGAIAHNAVLAAKGLRRARYPFAHGAMHDAAGRHRPRRQLSLLAAQHQHRPAHPGDVRSGDRRPRRAPRRLELSQIARAHDPRAAPLPVAVALGLRACRPSSCRGPGRARPWRGRAR